MATSTMYVRTILQQQGAGNSQVPEVKALSCVMSGKVNCMCSVCLHTSGLEDSSFAQECIALLLFLADNAECENKYVAC